MRTFLAERSDDPFEERARCLGRYRVAISREDVIYRNAMGASVQVLKNLLRAVDVEPCSDEDAAALRAQVFRNLAPATTAT